MLENKGISSAYDRPLENILTTEEPSVFILKKTSERSSSYERPLLKKKVCRRTSKKTNKPL